MMTQAEMSTELIIDLIATHNGNLSEVARALGTSRTTLYAFINSHPTCKRAMEDVREGVIDNVEHVLHKKALEGEAWAVCFFLKTQAKHRGYTERQEVTGADGNHIEVVVRYENQSLPR